jgi:hypothetical protein
VADVVALAQYKVRNRYLATVRASHVSCYCAPGSNLSKLTLACCELQIQRDFSRTPADEIILRSFRAEVRGL